MVCTSFSKVSPKVSSSEIELNLLPEPNYVIFEWRFHHCTCSIFFYFLISPQECHFKFVSWTHDKSELHLQVDPRPLVTQHHIPSPEWSLVSVKREVYEELYPCCPIPYSTILYTLSLHRKSLFYVVNAVIPCFIQMFIILFTFFFPPECGERIGVVITVLLVFAVYLEVISSNLPKTSISIPALSVFYISAMAVSSCSLLATSFVLVVYYKGRDKTAGPVPRWACRLFFGGVARFLGVNTLKLSLPSSNNHSNLSVESEKLDDHPYTNDIMGKYNSIDRKCKNDDNNGDERHLGQYGALVEEVRTITQLIHNMELQDGIENQWTVFAQILDRIFFLVFVVVYPVLSISILLPVYMSYISRDVHLSDLSDH